jgi:hypothetical protein
MLHQSETLQGDKSVNCAPLQKSSGMMRLKPAGTRLEVPASAF